jgi:hypothetical protein
MGFLATLTKELGFSASLKHLSRWEDAAPYTLLNAQVMYHPTPKLELALRAHNLLGTDIALPEIARDDDDVPTIPQTNETTVYGSMSYSF